MRWLFVIVVPSSGTLKSTFPSGVNTIDIGSVEGMHYSDKDALVLKIDVGDCCKQSVGAGRWGHGPAVFIPSLLLRDIFCSGDMLAKNPVDVKSCIVYK